MDGLLSALATAGGLLLGVAVFVACWEQWRQGADLAMTPRPPRVVSLDVNLDALPAAGADLPQRHATLDAAMDRMVRGPAEAVSPGTQSWLETRPMVSTHSTDASERSGPVTQ